MASGLSDRALLEKLESLMRQQNALLDGRPLIVLEHPRPLSTLSEGQPRRRRKSMVEQSSHGSRMLVWGATGGAVRRVCLPHVVLPGPRDALIEAVVDSRVTTLLGSVDGDFLPDPFNNPIAVDLSSTYAIVRGVTEMWRRTLGLADWCWQWDLAVGSPQRSRKKSPLRLMCHAGEKANSAYVRSQKALKFYYMTECDANGDASVYSDKTFYLCRLPDIVAHEAGHAVLDALSPALYSIKTGQTGALHEAFADLTALFYAVDQPSQCEEILAQCKCDLRKAPQLSCIGARFRDATSWTVKRGVTLPTPSEELYEEFGARNMNNALVGSDCGTDLLSLTRVFTGFVFDILVDVFAAERDPHGRWRDAEALRRVASWIRGALGGSFRNGADDFASLAKGMEMALGALAVAGGGRHPHEHYAGVVSCHRDLRQLERAGAVDFCNI